MPHIDPRPCPPGATPRSRTRTDARGGPAAGARGPGAVGLAGLLLLTGLAAGLPPGPLAAAQDAAPPDRSAEVAACDSLVALRQLAAGAHEDRARALAQASGQAGCRLVPRAAIGAVERRAMFGGAPYECLAVASGGCLWVLP